MRRVPPVLSIHTSDGVPGEPAQHDCLRRCEMRTARLTAVLLVVTGPAGMLLAATPSKPVTPRQRLIARLYHRFGLSEAKIAGTLGITKQSVSRNLNRARKKISKRG